jgi:HSP20 family protein
MWAPQIEVLENEKTLTVRADLPGLNKEDINVEIKDDFLVVSGERKLEEEEKREGFYRSERNYGSFYRAIPLPEGAKMDNAKATFVNGVLEVNIEVPAALHKGRKLEISTTAPPQTKAAGR